MSPLMISLTVFVGVSAFVGAIASLLMGGNSKRAEDRLDVLAGLKTSEEQTRITKDELVKLSSQTIDGALGLLMERFRGIGLFFEQADSPIGLRSFLLISVSCGIVGAALGLIGNAPTPLLPLFGLLTATFPFIWLSFRRKKRFKQFAKQLPDAMELMGRALRSGHSLASGLHLVCDEMPPPISQVFRSAYETQNLGVPVESALKESLKKMPNLDFKFFVTAVAIQRQTGGDLAEILDKISEVIRERFKILGTVQALTGEGRLSGAVLMAMPIAIFFAVYYLNPNYVMVLFTTDLGKKMIAVGIVMQILGAVAIKKIIDIKV